MCICVNLSWPIWYKQVPLGTKAKAFFWRFGQFGCLCSLPHSSICISLSGSCKQKLRRHPVYFFCVGCHLRRSCKHTTLHIGFCWKIDRPPHPHGCYCSGWLVVHWRALTKARLLLFFRIEHGFFNTFHTLRHTANQCRGGKNALVSRGEGGYCVTIRQQILFTWNQVEWQIILTPLLLSSHRQCSLKNRTNLLMVSTDGQIKSFIFQPSTDATGEEHRHITHDTDLPESEPRTWCAMRMEEI